MPKIMYRPNPVPPPFVPPTPPEYTNVVVITKYPFEANELVDVYFKNVEIPLGLTYVFQIHLKEQQLWLAVNDYEQSLPNESNPNKMTFDADSSEIDGYNILCQDEGENIKTVPLMLQTA